MDTNTKYVSKIYIALTSMKQKKMETEFLRL